MKVNAKAVISGFTIGAAVLGVIGLVFVIKSNEKKDDRKKTSNTKTPQTLVEVPAENAENNSGKKIEVPDIKLPEDIFKESYSDVTDLLKDVLYYLIKTGFEKDPEILLERTIRYCTHFIEDYSWFENIPSSIESLENSIRELGYEKIYFDSLGIIKEEV